MAGTTQYTDVVLKGGADQDTESLKYDSSCSVRLMETDKQVLQQ